MHKIEVINFVERLISSFMDLSEIEITIADCFYKKAEDILKMRSKRLYVNRFVSSVYSVEGKLMYPALMFTLSVCLIYLKIGTEVTSR